MSETNGDDELLSARQLADELGVNWEVLTKAIKRGDIYAIRTPSGHYRVSRLDVPPGWVDSVKRYSEKRWGPNGERRQAQESEVEFLRAQVRELVQSNARLVKLLEEARARQ